jgi:hypothetical protein
MPVCGDLTSGGWDDSALCLEALARNDQGVFDTRGLSEAIAVFAFDTAEVRLRQSNGLASEVCVAPLPFVEADQLAFGKNVSGHRFE